MKKHLYLATFFVTLPAQAEPVLLERMEHLSFNPELKTVFTQHYDQKTQQLEVLSESEGGQPFRHKRIVQYDTDGQRIINWEEFLWDNTAQQWLKDAKGHSDFAESKETYTTYQGKNGEWVAL